MPGESALICSSSSSGIVPGAFPDARKALGEFPGWPKADSVTVIRQTRPDAASCAMFQRSLQKRGEDVWRIAKSHRSLIVNIQRVPDATKSIGFQLAMIAYWIASSLNRGLRALTPGIHKLLRGNSTLLDVYRTLRRRSIVRGTTAERFRIIYEMKWWGSKALSGEGSTLSSTKVIRHALPTLFRDLNIRTLLDAPCGDFLWFAEIENDLESYIGGDIVPALVERNTARFGKAGRSFITLDITSDPLPSADLWLCRDCFIHLDYAHVFKALENLARADIKYFVASNYPTLKGNKDTFVGGFRPLNLLLPPFNFPLPMMTIDDGNDGDARNLSLWQTDVLRPRISHSSRSRFPRLGR